MTQGFVDLLEKKILDIYKNGGWENMRNGEYLMTRLEQRLYRLKPDSILFLYD